MKRELVLSVVSFVILVVALGFASRVWKAHAGSTIFIRADGSIEPLNANITSSNNVTYLFTDDNHDSLIVEKDNIVVDGLGHRLEGGGSGNGIRLSDRINVTIKNVDIRRFDFGINVYNSSYIEILGNIIYNLDIFLLCQIVEDIVFNEFK